MSLPNFYLDGKVAIITGASGGVGKALSLGFTEAGASVVLAARRPAPLQAVADEIIGHGRRALTVPTDVTNSTQVSEMVQKSLDEFGHIDVLVNCAGGGVREATLDMTEKSWHNMVDFNLKSVFLCSQMVGRVMVKQGNGSIINFATAGAQVPVPGYNHYTVAKAGVIHFTRVLAAEWGCYNIRVNCISPGLIDDNLGRSIGPNFEKSAKSTALGRAAQPEDLLPIAMFLASDAASYITGAIINITGGPV
jgi:NAD(P)-dependent dehydrogenase (short-subunit alcohol dehydrogenase family)